MKISKRPTRLIPATIVSEGAGVTVQRTIGSTGLRNYDPFMLLDYFNSDNPDEYIAGFPSHPHRGFSTFTYMLNGHMTHKDSMGNTGTLSAGAAQLMKAASGVIHSEMPKQEKGLMRGFQLWINLPAANKMDAPAYQEYQASAFPVIETPTYRVKLLIGNFDNESAPIIDNITYLSYLDVQVNAGKFFQHKLPREHHSFIYVFEGNGQLNDKTIPQNTLVTLGSEAYKPNIVAGDKGIRFILISGKPIHEPIVQYGPFVMNTREEINQAMQDFQSNNFVRDRAWVNREKMTSA